MSHDFILFLHRMIWYFLQEIQSNLVRCNSRESPLTVVKGTLRLFGTLAYSPYPPELDKSIHTFFISVLSLWYHFKEDPWQIIAEVN